MLYLFTSAWCNNKYRRYSRYYSLLLKSWEFSRDISAPGRCISLSFLPHLLLLRSHFITCYSFQVKLLSHLLHFFSHCSTFMGHAPKTRIHFAKTKINCMWVEYRSKNHFGPFFGSFSEGSCCAFLVCTFWIKFRTCLCQDRVSRPSSFPGKNLYWRKWNSVGKDVMLCTSCRVAFLFYPRFSCKQSWRRPLDVMILSYLWSKHFGW